jgi:hypothetical protein
LTCTRPKEGTPGTASVMSSFSMAEVRPRKNRRFEKYYLFFWK